VVDDDPMMLRILAPHLEELGSVQTAQTPRAALAALDAIPAGPLAVLSDFNLKAEMNGVDVLREVERRRPDAARVLFSGYALDQLGEAGRDPALHGFVEKPMRVREMLPPIRAILDRVLSP
jgi:two-component system chemotaxis sensor kinase CheA